MLQVEVVTTRTISFSVGAWQISKEVPRDVHVACHSLYANGLRVSAIKYARQQLGLGLKEAKDLCDNLALIPV